jgi:heterodisulfide reductase subunit A-like polyferredoxin
MRKIFYVVIFTTLATLLLAGTSRALDTEKSALIVSRCNEIKKNIKKLQVADANTRVALGREYENILTKLMTNMNSRLALNHQPAGNLLSLTADFSAKLAVFREAYQSYDQKIEALLAVNCAKDPVGFYDALDTARANRAAVQSANLNLIQTAETYAAELTAIWSAE